MTTLTELRQRAEAMGHEDSCRSTFCACCSQHIFDHNLSAYGPMCELREPTKFEEQDCDCPRAALLEAVAGMEEGIKKMAEQMTGEEMNAEYGDGGDYEYGYNELVKQARSLLADTEYEPF